MLNPKILKENKLIIEGYQAKENARQHGVLICTDAKKKTFEFVKVRDLPFQINDDGTIMTIGEYLDTLENIVAANYEDIIQTLNQKVETLNQAILALADQIDKDKFL